MSYDAHREDIKNTHMFTGIAAIFGWGWLVALIMFLVNKDKHPQLRQEGANQLNFQLSMLIYAVGISVVSAILMLIFIGFLTIWLAFVPMIMGIVYPFIAMGQVGYKFPLTINMVK